MDDRPARQTALDPTRSFIVQAPAGSGKTGLLVYRILKTLATVERPEQVLAITFTRKATAEMRERLLELLQKAERAEIADNDFEQQGIDLAAEVLERDAERQWRLLDSPDQLQIHTIDAYCSRLASDLPWLSRLGDRPGTVEDAQHLYSAAVDALLSTLAGNAEEELHQALLTVMRELQFDYQRARRLFTTMLTRRDQWLRHLVNIDLASLRAQLNESWLETAEDACRQAQAVMPERPLNTLLELAAWAAPQVSHPDNALPSFLENPPTSATSLTPRHWQDLVKLLTTSKAAAIRKSVDTRNGFPKEEKEKKKQFTELLAALRETDDVLPELQNIAKLPLLEFDDEDWQQLVALQKVLLHLAALLQLEFRRTGECDHSEVSQRALLALSDLDSPTNLALRMDYQLRHILVDEFQDTSRTQLELLRQLTCGWQKNDGHSLFLVGDPMQSIYRFREADVSLFLQVVDNQNTGVFDNLEIESLQLSENFRSRSDLVSWFNRTFADSFPATDNVLTGAIQYAHSSSSRPDGGQVETVLAEDDRAEAQYVVAAVKQHLDRQDQSKIAILVSSRGHLKEILPGLESEGIDYAGVDIKPLNQVGPVQDLISLTKALCRQDSRLDWLAVLRSPLIGLSLSELQDLVSQDERTIWQLLKDQQDHHATNPRVARFIEVLDAGLSQVHSVKLAALVRWVWRALGGDAFSNELSEADAERVFSIIDEHDKGGGLLSVKLLDEALAGLYAQPAISATARVIVSTVHKAKGLQYHTVILPGLDRPAPADQKSVLMWAERDADDGEPQLLIAPIRLQPDAGGHFDYLRHLEKQRGAAERVRRMYVACTRAEVKLVMIARANLDKDGELREPVSSSLLRPVWAALESSFELVAQDNAEAQTLATIDTQLHRLPPDYQPKFEPAIAWRSRDSLNESAEQNELEFSWATELATGVGVVLHAWLEANSTEALTAVIDQGQKHQWRAQLRDAGVPDERIAAGVERLTRACAAMKQDKHAQFIFDTHQHAANELALTRYQSGELQRFKIDRTFVDQSDTRWIVDFKATATNRADIEQFVSEQVRDRHRSQLENYGSLMAKIDARPIKLAVYFPLLGALYSWDYNQAQA